MYQILPATWSCDWQLLVIALHPFFSYGSAIPYGTPLYPQNSMLRPASLRGLLRPLRSGFCSFTGNPSLTQSVLQDPHFLLGVLQFHRYTFGIWSLRCSSSVAVHPEHIFFSFKNLLFSSCNPLFLAPELLLILVFSSWPLSSCLRHFPWLHLYDVFPP